MSPYIVIYSKKLGKIGREFGNFDFYLYICIYGKNTNNMKKAEYLKKFNLNKAIQMMKDGRNQSEIGIEFGISPQRVSDCFKFYNIKFDRRGLKINDSFFDIIDTELKAYLLGFLVADGCCKLEKRRNGKRTKRISFNNTIDDKEAIEALHTNICPDSSLLIKNYTHNRRKKPQYTLQWTSEHMFDILGEKYNIKPLKTKDKEFFIPESAISDELWRHFIRGFFDGDGHVGSCTIEFVFTSEPFMKQIMNWFRNFHYRTYHIQGKTTDYWKVIIPAPDKIKKCIYDFFYKDSTIFLHRKYEAFNTEISYSITKRAINIVEHRPE